MYEAYWSLREMPFENTPDPRFFFASPQHQEGLARLTYVVQGRKGAGVLTGVFGCGKTLLARSLLSQLSQNRYRIAYVANPLMSEVELLRGIAHKLNVASLPDRRSEILIDALLESIEKVLWDNARDGKETLVIIDEAHVIREERVFEELRLLLNFQDEERFLLTLILMGQPELKETVDRNKPLAQRLCMGYHLVPLTDKETAEYIRHRLTVAGAQRPGLFTEAALRLLYEHSGGIPRRINQLCDLSLLTGMHRGAQVIEDSVIEDVVATIGV